MKWILAPWLFLSIQPLAIADTKIAKMKSVNFIQEGEVSQLILEFDKKISATKKHIKSDKQIILDLKNVEASRKLLRGIDTSEFSGSSVYVSPYKKPGSQNDLRFAVQLRDNVRSILKNKGKKVILYLENRFGVFNQTQLAKKNEDPVVASVKNKNLRIPKSSKLNDILENLTQSGVKRYVGRKISLNVNNISYAEILKMIGDTSGFNIIIEDEVKELKPLTISLTNLPWDQVLDTIMKLGKLVAVKFGNILTITTEEKARLAKKKELEELDNNKELVPLVTKLFSISYAKLDDLVKILKTYLTEKRGRIQQDERTQRIIVQDTPIVVERMAKIIKSLDAQTPQILIEAKVVEAEEKYEFRAGLTDGLKIGYDSLGPVADAAKSKGVFALNSATSPTRALMNATINVGRLTNLAFSLELMESESKGKVVTSPKVITQNNKEAEIINNIQRAFQTTTVVDGETRPAVEKINAAISLKVTPKVTNEGSIGMAVELVKSGFGATDVPGELPPLTSRSVKTNVLVENGSTIVIGGIYQTDDQKVNTGVPFLKDLPLIGWLFKNAYNPSKLRNELIIFLTPRIINREEAGLSNNLPMGALGN